MHDVSNNTLTILCQLLQEIWIIVTVNQPAADRKFICQAIKHAWLTLFGVWVLVHAGRWANRASLITVTSASSKGRHMVSSGRITISMLHQTDAHQLTTCSKLQVPVSHSEVLPTLWTSKRAAGSNTYWQLKVMALFLNWRNHKLLLRQQATCNYSGSHHHCWDSSQQAVSCVRRVGRYILGKANKILMVGVDVGKLNVNQQQNLKADNHD